MQKFVSEAAWSYDFRETVPFNYIQNKDTSKFIYYVLIEYKDIIWKCFFYNL